MIRHAGRGVGRRPGRVEACICLYIHTGFESPAGTDRGRSERKAALPINEGGTRSCPNQRQHQGQHVRSRIGVLALDNKKEKQMSTKLHYVDSQDLVRSVLTGSNAKAACGFSKVFTREDVENARRLTKTCKGCLVAAGDEVARGTQVVLNPAAGWTALLEHVWKAKNAAPKHVTRFTISTSKQWGFPLAA